MKEEGKTKRTRRQYDEAYRREAVALVESSGRSLSEIARELGISHWNLRDWIPLYGRRSEAGQLAAQVARLQKENANLRQQRDALKKVLGILAEPPENASKS
jgi:transposase